MAKPFVSLNVSAVTGQVRATQGELRAFSGAVRKAMTMALAKYAEFILSRALDKAPIETRPGFGGGRLKESATVSDPVIDGARTTIQVGFSVPYAAIRDQGGIIRPVRAKALFIPLKPGVRPSKSKNRKRYVLGVDFVLVPGPTNEWQKRFVKQQGTRYFTNTINELAPRAEELIAKGFEEAMGAIRG